MAVIGWILFGFVVGLIARAIMPGRDTLGLIGTTILGIVGSVLGGYTGRAFGWYGPNDGASFLAAVAGAIIVLFVFNLASGRKRIRRDQHRDDIHRAA